MGKRKGTEQTSIALREEGTLKIPGEKENLGLDATSRALDEARVVPGCLGVPITSVASASMESFWMSSRLWTRIFGPSSEFISPKCTHLIRALDGLTYKDGTKLVDKSSGLDHIVDALGYLIMGVFSIYTNNCTATGPQLF
jgi:hypothetical protein